MAKQKTSDVLNALREYINRNSFEEDVPAGWLSKDECIKLMDCSKKQLERIVKRMEESGMCKTKYIKRHKSRRIYDVPYYWFDPVARRILKLK